MPGAAEMQQVLKTYQENRDVYELLVNRYGINALVVKALRQQFAADDSVMLIKMLSIVNTYGWRGKAYFGEASSMALLITFMHAGISYQKKYFSLMKEAALKGNLPPEGFAMIADCIALHDSGQQLYGTQFRFRRGVPGYAEPFPVASPEELDVRRKQIGLEPYQQFIAHFNPESLRQYCLYYY